MVIELFTIIVIIFMILIAIIYFYKGKARSLEILLNELAKRKHSQSTKYGKLTEQFFPFLDRYPYNERNFRFIGSPIDGIQFEPDKIIFVEFKTANGKLSAKQREIKYLIDKKRVEFKEFRIK